MFLAYRDSALINEHVSNKTVGTTLSFYRDDGVEHTVWKFEDAGLIEAAFSEIPATYVADGHHDLLQLAWPSSSVANLNHSW